MTKKELKDEKFSSDWLCEKLSEDDQEIKTQKEEVITGVYKNTFFKIRNFDRGGQKLGQAYYIHYLYEKIPDKHKCKSMIISHEFEKSIPMHNGCTWVRLYGNSGYVNHGTIGIKYMLELGCDYQKDYRLYEANEIIEEIKTSIDWLIQLTEGNND